MRPTRILAALLTSLALFIGLVSAPPAGAAPRLPNSIASLGDSITRAADVCCWYGDHPAQSWSTGYAGWDNITSHYEHVKALHPRITGYDYNDAVSGARARDLPSQVSKAINQGAQYVTLLIGGNDLCTSSAATMTSTADFSAQVNSALATLHQALPNTRIFVSSIPNIYQLWNVLHTNPLAQFVWSVANICQSMLSPTLTEADRQLVVARELAFNDILARACAKYATCRWDGNAVYNLNFSASQVSTLDYFHPSLSGQAKLAQVTWQASWWGA